MYHIQVLPDISKTSRFETASSQLRTEVCTQGQLEAYSDFAKWGFEICIQQGFIIWNCRALSNRCEGYTSSTGLIRVPGIVFCLQGDEKYGS
jgi:hypothetical protein